MSTTPICYTGPRVTGSRVAGRSVPARTSASPDPGLPRTGEVAAAPAAAGEPGRRRAAPRQRRPHPLVRALRPRPVLVGVAALAIAFGGAASSATQDGDDVRGALSSNAARTLLAPTALGGTSDGGSVSTGTRTDDSTGTAGTAAEAAVRRPAEVSRDFSRQTLESSSGPRLVAAAEKQAQERNAALAQFAAQAEQQAAKLAEDVWSLPLDDYDLTAEYGEVGLWATYHTGLDFAAPTGSPLRSVANGTVTEAGYDGSYGNKTVVTLDDGTEIWYCHQDTMDVAVGDAVASGQVIGTVGSTGNSTGPHLHLEVRPGGGDPVDPYSALSVNGLTP